MVFPAYKQHERSCRDAPKISKHGGVVYIPGGLGRRHPDTSRITRQVMDKLHELDPHGSMHYIADVSRVMGRYNGHERREKGTARSDAVYNEVCSHRDFVDLRNYIFRRASSKKIVMVNCKGGNHRAVTFIRSLAEIAQYDNTHNTVQIDLATAYMENIHYLLGALIPAVLDSSLADRR